MKEFLRGVQERLKLEDKEFEEYLIDLEHTTNILAQEKIEFLSEFKLVFYAHIVSLIKRLKENISLECGDNFPEDEVEKRAVSISEKIILPMIEKYNREVDRMEIILAAIQLQLAMEMQKEK